MSQYPPPFQPYGQPHQPNYYGPGPSYGYGGPPEPKNSGIGVASFIISIISGITVALLLTLVTMKVAESGEDLDENSSFAMGLGCVMILAMALSLVGLILGIVAMNQPNSKKVFAVLGMIFNGLILVGMAGLLVIGSAMP